MTDRDADDQSRTISVASVSEGPGGDDTTPGASVSLPIVELLTGRGFVTGKSGSGKSNTASVMAEALLDEGFGLLVVDVEGEYYGLKEEFEVLHAGADEECDVQVSPEHAEKLATLALEQHVPIVLDVSGYLDEEAADELVFETVRHLFAKEKKLKRPFLLLVEEIHEYIPENGSTGDAGQMLVKVGKRGRKHGLGLLGISQRPADVKKDYITQCDWLVWHRLTWDNDTDVVRRILDGEHANAVEDLDDGEAFLATDWAGTVRRVQFDRKRTFDAGATPGLDEFERPDLKSVSGDLVDELQSISEDQARREDELDELRDELAAKEERIAELERELERARDLERMADRFTDALVDRTDGTDRLQPPGPLAGRPWPDHTGDADDDADGDDPTEAAADAAAAAVAADDSSDGVWDAATHFSDGASAAGERDDGASRSTDATAPATPTTDGDDSTDGWAIDWAATPGADDDAPDAGGDAAGADATADPERASDGDEDASAASARETADEAGDESEGESESEDAADTPTAGTDAAEPGTREALVADIAERVEALDETATRMLRVLRDEGRAEPVGLHVAAGGTGDRTMAYSRLRSLRRADLVRHASRGQYVYAVPELVRTECGDRLPDDDLAAAIRAVETTFVDDPTPGWQLRERDGAASDVAADDPDVEIVPASGSGSPAFRQEDAELVDVESDDDDAADDRPDARSAVAGEGRDATVMDDGSAVDSDGLASRNGEATDAEFVD